MAKLVITGETSGSVVIDSPAVSGSNTLTIPATTGQVVLCSSTTSAVPLPAGVTEQRPSSAVAGMMRMNTTTNNPEWYNGSVWTAFSEKPTYSIQYLIVGGGGGGNGEQSGGGGGGQVVENTLSTASGVTYTATIGAGGFPGTGSVFNGVTATFGAQVPYSGTAGTAGGNTSRIINGVTTSYTGGSGAGNNCSGTAAGGGGAGSGANGTNASTSVAGAGGAGYSSSITGSPANYGGGGGGGATGTRALGGAGGGGNGQSYPNGLVATAGTVNTGGGGGGGGGQCNVLGATPAAGGSGVVILSLPTASYSGVTTGSPTVTTSGSNTIIRFTSSGTYTS